MQGIPLGASAVPTVSYSPSRDLILPVGKHTRNTGCGGLGEDSAEAGIYLEMGEGKDALLCPSPALAAVALTNFPCWKTLGWVD